MTTAVCRFKPAQYLAIARAIGDRNAHAFRGLMKFDPDTMEATAPDGSRRVVAADDIELATLTESDGRTLTATFGDRGYLSIFRPYWYQD